MANGGERCELRRGVGLTGVVTLGAGTAIGVSIFTVLQPASQVAGAGMLVAIGIAMLPMMLFAIAYSYLGSALPVSGASYEWPSRFLHPLAGFLVVWLRILSNVGVITILSQVMIGYLAMIVPIPQKPGMAVLISIVFGLNYLGVGIAARVQSILMGALLVALAIFVVTGLPLASTATVGDPLMVPPMTILAAVPLLISLFLGIESAVEIGEEVRDPGRNVPLGIALAILLTAIVYSSVAYTALGLVGPAALAGSDAPLLTAAKVPLGALAMPLIVGAACFSIFKSMNAAALVFSRSLFAMGRNDALPTSVAAIHPRFGTPHRAIRLGYGLAMLGLFMPPSLVFILLAINVPTMLKYMACCLSAAQVARAHPDVHAQSKLRLRRGTIVAVSYAGAAVALVIVGLGVQADARPYLLVVVWLLVGLIYWTVRGGRRRRSRAG